jgi:hypothetical protein
MTNDEIKTLIANIREQLGVLAEKGDISAAMRQAMITRMIEQLAEIESGLAGANPDVTAEANAKRTLV